MNDAAFDSHDWQEKSYGFGECSRCGDRYSGFGGVRRYASGDKCTVCGHDWVYHGGRSGRSGDGDHPFTNRIPEPRECPAA